MATGRQPREITRREHARWMLASALALSVSGCASPWFTKKETDLKEIEAAEYQREVDNIKKLWNSPDRPKVLEEISRKVITLLRVENVALVTELPGTGGKVENSSQRSRLLDTMRRKGVANPNQVLDDPSTTMAVAQVVVPPAARKRDRLNVIVSLSKNSEASSLQGGWLMSCELVEMSALDGRIHEGFGVAMAEGTLVTQQQITGDPSKEAATRAMVVGGAQLMTSRNIELALDQKFAHAVTMATVLPPINKRFTVFDGSSTVGVAKPATKNSIELSVPPRYRFDADHFANVVQHIGVAESTEDKTARIERCRRELLEPTTARRAAYQLEAVGKEAAAILVEGLQHPHPEVRFYSAHALAYLNDPRSIPILQDLASSEPAFRAMCLNGLTIVESFRSGDALQELLHAPDIETRYGALLALREYDSKLPMLRGIRVEKVGAILEIPTSASPAVVVGLNNQPEIVIYGPNPMVRIDGFMYVNTRLIVRQLGPNHVSVSHIAPGKEDRIVESPNDLTSLLQAIASVGGNYGDWVNFVRICGAEQRMPAEVAMNPVPLSGRRFNRDQFEVSSQSLEESRQLSKLNEVSPPPDLLKEHEPRPWYNPWNWFGKN